MWGGIDEERKIAWVRWSDICKPVDDGGLGVRDLKTFNWALLWEVAVAIAEGERQLMVSHFKC